MLIPLNEQNSLIAAMVVILIYMLVELLSLRMQGKLVRTFDVHVSWQA
jgi:hypothetical protein